MAEKLINITAPQYRCNYGACPAVYKSEDGKTFTIIGFTADPSAGDLAGKVSVHESAVDISADLLLSSLGIAALIEAAEPFERWLSDLDPEFSDHEDDIIVAGRGENVITFGHLRALRESLSSIKGGK